MGQIPTTFSRTEKTFLKVANGHVVVTPLQGGDYLVSGPSDRRQRVNGFELPYIVRELVQRGGGLTESYQNPIRLSPESIVNGLLEGEPDPDDPASFMRHYLQTHFDDSAILKVYEYINDHQFGVEACETCEGSGEDPAHVGEPGWHECPACEGEGEVEGGSYRELVHLWNEAGPELNTLFARIAEAEKKLIGRPGKPRNKMIKKLFNYMQHPNGNYEQAGYHSHHAGKEIEAAIGRLRALETRLARKPR